eukprot:4168052-Amphidinium_carterae.1
MGRLWFPGLVFTRCGSGRHSSNPHFRRCAVGYHTDTGESVWLPLPGLKQFVYRAEGLATLIALEECQRIQLVDRSVIAKVWSPAFMLCVLAEVSPKVGTWDLDSAL